MQQPRLILAVFHAITLMPVAGFASTPMSKIASDDGDDSAITTRVIARSSMIVR